MSKKGSSNLPRKNHHHNGVAPDFKERIGEKYASTIDFGDAPDELRLSDRILRLVNPYR